MKNRWRFTFGVFVWATLLLVTYAVAAQAQANNTTSQSLTKKGSTPQAANGAVSGGGTPGRLSKWSGVAGSNTFVLGDSGIFEDKFGKVGIGTTTPTSLLTVAGMIETTLGGVKFPDGTVQTTAGLTPSQVVSSLNGLKGDVQLVAGQNLSIIPNGNTLIISAPNAMSTITHNATLTGNGTQGSPLGIAVPLTLTGSVPFNGANESVVRVENLAYGGGLVTVGGPAGANFISGFGLHAEGGSNTGIGRGGSGAELVGGPATDTGVGGTGAEVEGGYSVNGDGGVGLEVRGGLASGAGNTSGRGIHVKAGYPENGATRGEAGVFEGRVEVFGDLNVVGNLSKSGGSFKIDHPLDPENKYLYHSFVESPDMKNIYDGNVTTDANGEAVIEMPDYFEALNRDFRYQLTVIGSFAQAMVADEMKDNRFRIKTNAAGVKVSWQVTGIRQDAYANKHRIPVEEVKPEKERGFYLLPELYNQPEERSVQWAHNPKLMQQLKQQRIEAEQLHKQGKNKN
jgi:hypothetical protein